MLPLAKVAVIVLLTEAPPTTETCQVCQREIERARLGEPCACYGAWICVVLESWAFSSTSLEIVIGPEYFGDDCVSRTIRGVIDCCTTGGIR